MEQTIKNFIDLLSSQINRGIYVWGGNGEVLTDMRDPAAWIERRETSAENVEKDLALLDKRIRAGVEEIRAFDCSGLVYWALKSLGVLDHDLSSRGLYAACDKITEAELRAGDLVFHATETKDGTQRIVHVGIYDGAGEFIECRGRDVGVVKNKRKAGYWTHFGRFPGLSDDPQPDPPEPDPPKPTPPEPEPKRYYVKVVGGSVHVRAGDNVFTKKLGTVHNAAYNIKHKISDHADMLPLIGPAPSGWYEVEYKDTNGYISNKPKYTEVVYE